MRQSNSYFKMKDYFAEIVEQSNFLNDFAGYFARELHNNEASSSGLRSPALALFGYSFGVEGEEMSSTAVRKMSFGILINDVDPHDYEAQYHAIDKAEELALKVIARMRFDSNKNEHFLYNALIKNSIEVTPIELDGNGIFGVEVSFQLKNFQSMKLAPDDWKDIDRVC